MTRTTTSHREMIFGKLPPGSYIWCLHCGRTYRDGEFLKTAVGGFRDYQACPYEDCDGDAVIDSVPWEDIRRDNPGYPAKPERGVTYPDRP